MLSNGLCCTIRENRTNIVLSKPTASSALSQLIDSLVESKEIKTKSLISTIFGDCAAPYGGSTWTECLISILEPLKSNERLVRTSLFRLVEDGWLTSTRSGRKSYYQLSALGASQTGLAERIIYHCDDTPWDGYWTLVFPVIKPVSKQARNQLEQELQWMGFGQVSHHVWAHPLVTSDAVLERVGELDLLGKVVCMRCLNIEQAPVGFNIDDRELAKQCMPLDRVQEDYRRFIDRFQIFEDAIESLNDTELLTLRVLIIDQYRKIALNDSSLPAELLPAAWGGVDAFNLTAKIYRQIQAASDHHYTGLVNLVGDGLIKARDQKFDTRFSN